MNQLIIIGASGHGKVIADIAVRDGYKDIAFLDDNPDVHSCLGFPVLGPASDAIRYADSDFIVAIGNAKIREAIQTELCAQILKIVTLIHPDAVIARDVRIGRGTVVMAGAVINPGSIIGDGCIINTGATVDHDNQIGNFVHVSVGSHLAGTVTIGKSTWVGIGATVSNNLTICGDCMIGAGAVVVSDIKIPGTYIGVPAQRSQKTMKKFEKSIGGGYSPNKLASFVTESEAA